MRYAEGPTVEAAVHVAAPPAQVWPLVRDIQFVADTSEELQEAQWLPAPEGPAEGEAPAVGHRFRGRNFHPQAGEWETVSTVVECDEERRFSWAVMDTENPTATWLLHPHAGRGRHRAAAVGADGPRAVEPHQGHREDARQGGAHRRPPVPGVAAEHRAHPGRDQGTRGVLRCAPPPRSRPPGRPGARRSTSSSRPSGSVSTCAGWPRRGAPTPRRRSATSRPGPTGCCSDRASSRSARAPRRCSPRPR